MKTQTYCPHCDSIVNFYTDNINTIDELLDVEYTKTFIYCSICNNEIHDNDIDLQNNSAANIAYNDAVITIPQIQAILNYHNVNPTELSNLLGFEDDKITQYLNGTLPLMKNSRILKHLYNNPGEVNCKNIPRS